MKIYDIVKALQSAQGNIAKQEILMQNKDNELFRTFMWATYDPAVNFYQTKLPKISQSYQPSEEGDFAQKDIDFMMQLARREFTGNSALMRLAGWLSAMNKEGQELIGLMLKRSVGASVGDTMVLKTWPDLYFLPPYQRCSLMDDKIKGKFEALPEFYVQPKLDGSFLYLVVQPDGSAEAFTRAGSKYPSWFAEELAYGLKGLGMATVFVGEVEVYQEDATPSDEGFKSFLMTRQEGNGLLNAVLKGRDEDEFGSHFFKLTAWDILDEQEWKDGVSPYKYKERLSDLYDTLDAFGPPNLVAIETNTVTSLDEAYKIYSSYTEKGMEGAVIKAPDSKWKDGTAKDIVKLKIAFEAEYIVTGMKEGTGKAAGMLGALTIETSDGLLKCDVGTGFTDEQRKNMWLHRSTFYEDMVGKVVTVIANDVIGNRTSSVKSLFLPVYSDTRFDKTEADSLERVMEQLEAAKRGG